MFYETCPNCFEYVSGGVCPHCGYDQANSRKYDDVLPPETILNARYLLGRVLGKGGFGVTYVAKDLVENSLVAIKECMPEYYAYRGYGGNIVGKENNTLAFNQCKENFRDEINALYDLADNSFVVNAMDYFSENNTEYFTMEYIDGVSLKLLTFSNGGRISLNDAALVVFTIGSALMEIHKKGIIHRDISPENIMMSLDGSIKLIDFGACKNYFNNAFYKNESIFLKPGFAPPEQYDLNGNQGPWTDVYALAATFYTIVSGQPLVDSTYRVEHDTMKPLYDLDCGVSKELSDVIRRGLEPDLRYRYSDVGEFLNDISLNVESTGQIENKTLGIIQIERNNEQVHGTTLGLGTRAILPYACVMNGSQSGRRIAIPDYGFITVGREGKSSDIVLDDFAKISRQHCLIGYDRSNERFIIIDKSSNGTYFSNGRRMMYNAESYIAPNESFYVCENGINIKLTLSGSAG